MYYEHYEYYEKTTRISSETYENAALYNKLSISLKLSNVNQQVMVDYRPIFRFGVRNGVPGSLFWRRALPTSTTPPRSRFARSSIFFASAFSTNAFLSW
mmetsp:Transcript_8492/g.14631  ORF Transcript_8492/g.14631 Transcript_8492/m.14631 type:complete len:99 (+) Transcript_8492:30-326(+)